MARPCYEYMSVEPMAAREAKIARRRQIHSMAFHIKEAPRMRMWDPTAESGWFYPPRTTWLRWHDFFMSDAAPKPEPCHHYCKVSTWDVCHMCHQEVRTKWSGISCPCGHTWYCA